MDLETIKSVAEQIAQYLPDYSWKQFAIQAVLLAIAGGVGAFFGEFLRTSGKHFATQAHFESLSAQLRANTELVERVRSEVAQRDWVRREWATLRRQKLEALLQKMHESAAHLDRLRNASLAGEVLHESSPEGELDTIGNLYFPELAGEIFNFVTAFHKTRMASLDLAKKMIGASDAAAVYAAYEPHSGELVRKDFIEATASLKAAARRVLVQIAELPV